MITPVLLMTNAELAEAIDYAFAAIHKTAQAQDERRKLMAAHLAQLLDVQVQRARTLAERAEGAVSSLKIDTGGGNVLDCVQVVEDVVMKHGDEIDAVCWQRLKPRLTPGRVAITSEEWPALRDAIEKMLNECQP